MLSDLFYCVGQTLEDVDVGILKLETNEWIPPWMLWHMIETWCRCDLIGLQWMKAPQRSGY